MAGFLEWGSEISSVDRHIKNKFRWEWLNEEDSQGTCFPIISGNPPKQVRHSAPIAAATYSMV